MTPSIFFRETEFIFLFFFYVGQIFDFSKKSFVHGKPNFNLVPISKYFIF